MLEREDVVWIEDVSTILFSVWAGGYCGNPSVEVLAIPCDLRLSSLFFLKEVAYATDWASRVDSLSNKSQPDSEILIVTYH